MDNGHSSSTKGKRSPKFKDGTQLMEYKFNRIIVKRIAEKLNCLGIEYFILVPEEDKDIPPISPAEMMENILKEYSFGNILSEKLIEWVRYKDSRNESCQEYTIKCLLRRVDEELKIHDEGVIIQLIDNSILNGWKNIQWKDLKTNSSGTSGSYIEAINTRVSAVDDW